MDAEEASTTQKTVVPEEQRKIEECEKRVNASNITLEEPFCPAVWDSLLCWPNTPGGVTAELPCPKRGELGFVPYLNAHRVCYPNGTWFLHPESNKSWSNYTTCLDTDFYNLDKRAILVQTTGYSISLVALCISFSIFYYFKCLWCPRIKVHMNLFVSFAINNVHWLIYYGCITENLQVLEDNPLWCQLDHISMQMFLVSNYAWMLCEGLYLHTILVAAFISEGKFLWWLHVLGWVFPVIVTFFYALFRALFYDISSCWINNTKADVILVIPVCISIALNVGFLANILRVLYTKLRSGPAMGSARPSAAILQALRATLLLVPLLGLQYMITPYRSNERVSKMTFWDEIYEYTSAVISSFQGLLISMLFCFMNGEVIAQIRRRWQHLTFRPRANSCSATTVSFIRSTNGPALGEDKV